MELVKEVDSVEKCLYQVELSLSMLSTSIRGLMGPDSVHLWEKTKVMVTELADFLVEMKGYSSYSGSELLACSTGHLLAWAVD